MASAIGNRRCCGLDRTGIARSWVRGTSRLCGGKLYKGVPDFDDACEMKT